ncbi:VOC family protein [Fulvivirga sediminis]|uniref:VOC family protein n=1 Tax=Fulvivirga sediminis TaxID=2803949 RepID=A0A937K1Z1_9BACT|nr:VOC family protein [Fulvivirga sediminis]MBL3657835.1 VOC family protein [Fulvivirga sediminis]
MKEFTQIKENCLYIRDLNKAKNFYHHKLGLPIIHHKEDKHIFFKVGTSVLLCFNPDDSKLKTSPPPHFAEGNQHFAFEVNQNDYQAVKNKMLNLGITIIDTMVWGEGQESFYFHDPENNILEVVPTGVWN